MIKIINHSRLTRQPFFQELIDYLDQHETVILREIKREFEGVTDLLPEDMNVEEKLNISRAVFIFLHGLVTIYSSDYQECPGWVCQMLLNYILYTILRKKI